MIWCLGVLPIRLGQPLMRLIQPDVYRRALGNGPARSRSVEKHRWGTRPGREREKERAIAREYGWRRCRGGESDRSRAAIERGRFGNRGESVLPRYLLSRGHQVYIYKRAPPAHAASRGGYTRQKQPLMIKPAIKSVRPEFLPSRLSLSLSHARTIRRSAAKCVITRFYR